MKIAGDGEKMKVIVFGGSGFLGSHVANVLSAEGYQVTIYDLYESRYIQPGEKMIVGDLLDEAKVRAAVKGMDIIYNFAGIADIDEAAMRPLATVKNNILGNTLLLDAVKDEGIKRFLFASTLYVYSKVGSFYRCSKTACENYIEAYHERYGLEFTILRYGSLYGPRSQDWNGLKRFVVQGIKDGKIIYPGTGDERREYIHVQDAAKLSVKALDDKYNNQCLTLTGTQVMTTKQVLNMIIEIMNESVDLDFVPSGPTYNLFHYQMTPYRYTPKPGRKLVTDCFIDLGQGILDMINEVHQNIRNGSEKTDRFKREQ